MNEKNYGIYATHGNRKLLAKRANVDGISGVVYLKGTKPVAFEPLDSFLSQVSCGPRLQLSTHDFPNLTLQKTV